MKLSPPEMTAWGTQFCVLCPVTAEDDTLSYTDEFLQVHNLASQAWRIKWMGMQTFLHVINTGALLTMGLKISSFRQRTTFQVDIYSLSSRN